MDVMAKIKSAFPLQRQVPLQKVDARRNSVPMPLDVVRRSCVVKDRSKLGYRQHADSPRVHARGRFGIVTPNVGAKRATTVGRQARAGENVPRTARPGLVACRWRSA